MSEVLVRNGPDGVEVIQDGRTTGVLSMGEMIEQVIALTYGGAVPRLVPYRMETPEKWEEMRRRVAAEESIDEVYRD